MGPPETTSGTVEPKDQHVDDSNVTPPPNPRTPGFFHRLASWRVPRSDRNSSPLSPSNVRESKSKTIEVGDLTTDDTIIALMGPTGTGKSSFINMLIKNDKIVGHDLESCTTELSMLRIDDIVLVDTPGFDDTNKTDREILSMIADWLTTTYRCDIKLAGILYFHRITDNRVAGTPLKNLRMFEKLCGKHALGNIILTTTMWDKIDEKMGGEREKELREEYWKSMIKQGSTTFRYRNTRDSAWEILDKVLQSGHNRHAILLQKQMVELEMQLNETDAGRTLYTTLESLLKKRQDALDEIRAATGAQKDEEILDQMRGEYNELQKQLALTMAELQMMHISVGKRFLRYFASPQRFFNFL